MELNKMEKRMLYRTEGCERYAVIHELWESIHNYTVDIIRLTAYNVRKIYREGLLCLNI